MTEQDQALVALLATLQPNRYRFVTPTPATHARVLARREGQTAHDLRDVLGWSLPFAPETIDADIFALLQRGGVLEPHALGFTSRIRVATLGSYRFIHSAYPTVAQDAVFFGPDSYRFAAFLRRKLKVRRNGLRVADIGTGAGVGAAIAARMTRAPALATDINPLALRYAAINFAHEGVDVRTLETSGLDAVPDPIDIVVANPPYIADDARRAYRDGGAMHGAALSLDWAKAAAARLPRHGQLLLYTGSAIVGGRDGFKDALFEALPGFDIEYEEIDPDVFSEELEREAYADVERIAVMGVNAVRR
ncbi:MAG: methyltransferase [Hyphomonadaceae bacterium]